MSNIIADGYAVSTLVGAATPVEAASQTEQEAFDERVAKTNVDDLLDEIDAGELDAAEVAAAELRGRSRTTLLDALEDVQG